MEDDRSDQNGISALNAALAFSKLPSGRTSAKLKPSKLIKRLGRINFNAVMARMHKFFSVTRVQILAVSKFLFSALVGSYRKLVKDMLRPFKDLLGTCKRSAAPS